ncbi:MAG: hypothetical protein FWD61_17645, partial [Phycisphaerales bacterium]|nr:hypothetical protein [Phycisphaerales bacterium]
MMWTMPQASQLMRPSRLPVAALVIEHDQLPRHLGFTLACQEILSSWMLTTCGGCRDLVGHCRN